MRCGTDWCVGGCCISACAGRREEFRNSEAVSRLQVEKVV